MGSRSLRPSLSAQCVASVALAEINQSQKQWMRTLFDKILDRRTRGAALEAIGMNKL